LYAVKENELAREHYASRRRLSLAGGADDDPAAHAVDILATARRFVNLKRGGSNEHVGPCPRCGGRDRFGVNTRKRVFNCRGCAFVSRHAG